MVCSPCACPKWPELNADRLRRQIVRRELVRPLRSSGWRKLLTETRDYLLRPDVTTVLDLMG